MTVTDLIQLAQMVNDDVSASHALESVTDPIRLARMVEARSDLPSSHRLADESPSPRDEHVGVVVLSLAVSSPPSQFTNGTSPLVSRIQYNGLSGKRPG